MANWIWQLDMSEETEEMIRRVEEMEALCKEQGKLLENLIEYLERVDVKFKIDEANFFNWSDRLGELRREEIAEREIKKAKTFLQSHNYIVAADETELDAQKLRQWLSKK